jgi:positive regulator of sigma E activity
MILKSECLKHFAPMFCLTMRNFLSQYMFENLIVAALGLVIWERASFTFKTGRAEDIG